MTTGINEQIHFPRYKVLSKRSQYIATIDQPNYRYYNHCLSCRRNWPKSILRCPNVGCNRILRTMPTVKTRWKLKRY